MPKLTLTANPTFIASVGIPVAGGEPVMVKFTFRHRTKTALDEWIKSREGREDIDSVLEMVEGWELEEPFNRENVAILLENYIGTALATLQVYVDQLVQSRIKN